MPQSTTDVVVVDQDTRTLLAFVPRALAERVISVRHSTDHR